MKSKQSALLARLDTLDEECTELKEELVQVESNREKLVCYLSQVQAQYEQVQQQLNTEQVCRCYKPQTSELCMIPCACFTEQAVSVKPGAGKTQYAIGISSSTTRKC